MKAAPDAGQKVLIASANSDLNIGTELDEHQQVPTGKGPLGLRLIGLPPGVLGKLSGLKANPSDPTSGHRARKRLSRKRGVTAEQCPRLWSTESSQKP